MKILLINDTSSSSNWGSRATSFALKKMISETGSHTIQSITEGDLLKLKGFNNTSGPSNRLLKLLVPPIFFKAKRRLLFKEHIPRKWGDFDAYLRKTIRSNLFSEVLGEIEASDFVVVQGEGCIRHNTFLSRILFFLAYISKSHFGKPVVMVNHTADLSHPELLEIAQNVYPLLDDVVFRDHLSVEKYSNFSHGRFAADSTFTFRPISNKEWYAISQRPTYFDFWPEDASTFNPGRPYICLGGGSGLPSENENRYSPIDKYSELIQYLQKNLQHQIVLTVSGYTDLWIFRALADKFGLPLIGLNIPVQQAVDIMGNASAYIGGRWHPSLFAVSGGTPVIPFQANTFKMKALTRLFSLKEIVFDVKNMERDKELILSTLQDYLAEGLQLREELIKKSEEYGRTVPEHVAYLRSYMDAN